MCTLCGSGLLFLIAFASICVKDSFSSPEFGDKGAALLDVVCSFSCFHYVCATVTIGCTCPFSKRAELSLARAEFRNGVYWGNELGLIKDLRSLESNSCNLLEGAWKDNL